MKVVILAGGVGSRLREISKGVPKPMIEIGGRPILWHIMSHYAKFGLNEFIICLGYKGHVIKDFFVNYSLHNSNIEVKLDTGHVEILERDQENWSVKLIDTGQETMTGGRIKRLEKIIGNETFCMTYGDALSNVNISDLMLSHQRAGKLATVTAVVPQGRFGVLSIDASNSVNSFVEKPTDSNSMINGGFFVLEPGIFSRISGDEVSFEQGPLNLLSKDNQLNAFIHRDFWQCMDTPRDWELLEKLVSSGNPPWRTQVATVSASEL